MWAKNLLVDRPQVIFKTASPISGEIKVFEYQGSRALDVGGYLQSATPGAPEFERRYWARAAEEISKRLAQPKSALVIGVGGGTILRLLAQKFPDLAIIGVELDPEIVAVAKKFFDLDQISNLTIIVGDGATYVRDYRGDKFDLVLIDAYLGGNYPSHFEEARFFQEVKAILSPVGIAAFNRTSGSTLGKFRKMLEENFATIEEIKIPLPGFLGGLGGNFLFFVND